MQYDYRGERLQNLKILVCDSGCYDTPQEQLRSRILGPDPLPINIPSPERDYIDYGYINDGGVLQLINVQYYPTKPTGLLAGALWNNGLTVGIILGITPNPTANAIIYGQFSAYELLTMGGGNFPLNNPGAGTNQLWNDKGVLSIA